MPSMVGSTPFVTACLKTSPSLNPNRFMSCFSKTNIKAAPSFFIQLFPTVTVPPGKSGLNRLNLAGVNRGFKLSSCAKVCPLSESEQSLLNFTVLIKGCSLLMTAKSKFILFITAYMIMLRYIFSRLNH